MDEEGDRSRVMGMLDDDLMVAVKTRLPKDEVF